MAKIEVTRERTVCDRCGRSVTENGRKNTKLSASGPFQGEDGDEGPDLCRECWRAIVRWWEKPSREESAT